MNTKNTLKVYEKTQDKTVQFTEVRRNELIKGTTDKVDSQKSTNFIPKFKFHLNALLEEKQSDPSQKMTKEAIYSECLASRNQLQKYFNTNSHEPKSPSRDIIIMIGIAMELKEYELGELLESASFSRLDVIKDSRDRFILNCIKDQHSVEDINKALLDNNYMPF